MSELGKDILSGEKVIISRNRINKPIDSCLESNNLIEKEYSENCPFCRGNEHLIPKETFVIKEENKWVVKSVINKYPIIDTNQLNELRGVHEVMIDNYNHNTNFYNMNVKEFYNMLIMYKNRYRSLKDEKESKYICIFKNYLRGAGASLIHTHSQIISLPLIPPELINEYNICEEYYRKMGISIYDNIITRELNESKRVVYNSEKFFVFIPEVSRFMGETIIILKENKYFEEIIDSELLELSDIFKKYFFNIQKLNGNCPFNLYIHVHPVHSEDLIKESFNVHIHIVPRKFNLGGFELSTGLYVTGGSCEQLVEKIKFD